MKKCPIYDISMYNSIKTVSLCNEVVGVGEKKYFAFERYRTMSATMNYMLHFVKKEKIKNRILGANVKYTFTGRD